MFLRKRQSAKDDGPAEDSRMRRKAAQSGNFRVGHTMAGDSKRERQEQFEHEVERKKLIRKRIIGSLILVAIIAVAALLVVLFVKECQEQQQKNRDNEAAASIMPSVEIINMDATKISKRVYELVSRLESDAHDYGFSVSYAQLPNGMPHEVDIFVDGREEYYKLSLERGSAVQAEDIGRLIRYFDEHNIKCTYADIRVEGKVFYK